MTDNGWQAAGNVVTVASVTTFALTGGNSIASIYQAYFSPCTSLENSRQVLEEVRSRLEMLSPQRREQIEAACQRGPSSGVTPTSLGSLERALEKCVMVIGSALESVLTPERLASLICTVS